MSKITQQDLDDYNLDELIVRPYLDWEQLSSIIRYRGGRVDIEDTMLGEGPELSSGDQELVKIVTNGCGKVAAILINNGSGSDLEFLGEFDTTVLDHLEDSNDITNEMLYSWTNGFIRLLHA